MGFGVGFGVGFGGGGNGSNGFPSGLVMVDGSTFSKGLPVIGSVNLGSDLGLGFG